METAGDGYVVEHLAETFIVAPDGELVGKMGHATPPDQVVAAIRRHSNQR